MHNKDRNGKWQPFDALEGYRKSLKNVEHEKGKVEKPILFPDELELLSLKMSNAYNEKKEIIINYYKNGYIENIIGNINKIDLINKEIIVKTIDESVKLKMNHIVMINEID